MKKFAGNKSLLVIESQCKNQGLVYDDKFYRERGWDTIQIRGGGCTVIYNTFNGRFFGTTPTGVTFDSNSEAHENESWFQALVSFFYAE